MRYLVIKNVYYQPLGQENLWRSWEIGSSPVYLDTDDLTTLDPPLDVEWLIAEGALTLELRHTGEEND